MDKTYRWVVAGVFVFLSLLMLKRPVTFPSFKFESQANLASISLEQREVLFSALSRIENKDQFSSTAEKVTSVIQKEAIEVLVSNSTNEDKIKLKEGLGIVVPEKFFEADPIDQELALSHWFKEVAQINWGNESHLARIPKIKK